MDSKDDKDSSQPTNVIDLLRVRNHYSAAGTSSTTGTTKKVIYPAWVRDFFTAMQASYGSLWTDQLTDERATEVVKRIWYLTLKDYPVESIGESIVEVCKTYAFPPRPAEMTTILNAISKRNREEDQYQARLNEPKKIPTLSKASLEAKLQMYTTLGMTKLVEATKKELSSMTLEQINRKPAAPSLGHLEWETRMKERGWDYIDGKLVREPSKEAGT